MTTSMAAIPDGKPRLTEGSRPQHSQVRSQWSSSATYHSTGGRTCNDARRARRDQVRESGKHPKNFTVALGPGCRCGLVVVNSMVQRARAAGDGQHALLPTAAAMGPAQTAPEAATKTRDAYVGSQIQRTAQRAARKKSASPSSKTKSNAEGAGGKGAAAHFCKSRCAATARAEAASAMIAKNAICR
jgi:hypothetical protein